MATTTNVSVTYDAWVSILTSSDGPATIEARNGDMEYAYSTSSISINTIKGLTLAKTNLNELGSLVNSQLRVDRPLISGLALYGRSLKQDVTVTAVVSKDYEMFGA